MTFCSLSFSSFKSSCVEKSKVYKKKSANNHCAFSIDYENRITENLLRPIKLFESVYNTLKNIYTCNMLILSVNRQ